MTDDDQAKQLTELGAGRRKVGDDPCREVSSDQNRFTRFPAAGLCPRVLNQNAVHGELARRRGMGQYTTQYGAGHAGAARRPKRG